MGDESAHILVVDDNRPHRTVIAFNLEKAGFRVTTAADAAEALGLAESGYFDLVIVDYFMPRCNGEELIRRLRETDRYAETPMILLSARTNELDLQHLYNRLSILVMSKQCSMARLTGMVWSCLAKKQSAC